MKKNLLTALWVTAIIWIVFLLNFIIFFAEFKNLGIKPRTVEGLIGIALSPFLHAGWGHLISNSIPLFILTFLILQFYKKLWIPVTIFSIILGGFCVWLIAKSGTNHIGASGVIFSYIGFLLFSGIFRKSPIPIIIGIIVLFLYGGALIRGIIPGQPGISVSGHFFGAIAGVVAAYIYRNKSRGEENFKLFQGKKNKN
jgi:membrane associated rhomboid family serine protease